MAELTEIHRVRRWWCSPAAERIAAVRSHVLWAYREYRRGTNCPPSTERRPGGKRRIVYTPVTPMVAMACALADWGDPVAVRELCADEADWGGPGGELAEEGPGIRGKRPEPAARPDEPPLTKQLDLLGVR